MIDYYFWTTPNGYKVLVFLEEADIPYRIIPINISKGEQFNPKFLKISPNNKIPVVIDHKPNFSNTEDVNVKFPNPFDGPNSENILMDLSKNSIKSITNTVATDKDRKAISNYLTTFIKYHFDDIEQLKSFEVLKKIM